MPTRVEFLPRRGVGNSPLVPGYFGHVLLSAAHFLWFTSLMDITNYMQHLRVHGWLTGRRKNPDWWWIHKLPMNYDGLFYILLLNHSIKLFVRLIRCSRTMFRWITLRFNLFRSLMLMRKTMEMLKYWMFVFVWWIWLRVHDLLLL